MSIPVDIESLVEVEGCELIDWPFLMPVKEVKQGRWIGIAQGLDYKEKRHLIAHAFAHHLLHCGNQLSFYQHQHRLQERQEREAETCAAHILMPGPELAKVITHSFWELAEYFGVPEELAYQRINDFATEEEKELWEEACKDNTSA
jgi:Zn-dependent peptidase ImmA (M78 family)